MTAILPTNSTKPLVLLVEDDPTLKRTLTFMCEDRGFEVVAAVDYDWAVELIRLRTPNLVCLDLNLPSQHSGYDVCEFIRRDPKREWVQILIISDRKSPEDMAHAEEAGANAYLKKPFTLELFGKYLDSMLDGRNMSRPSVRSLKRSEPPPKW